MKQKKLIAEFQLDQQQFSLYLIEYEFILELKRHFRATRTSPKQNAWLAFADQATYEDVNAGIDAFQVMRLTRQHLVNYLTRHPLPYFYFHAATAQSQNLSTFCTAIIVTTTELSTLCRKRFFFIFIKVIQLRFKFQLC